MIYLLLSIASSGTIFLVFRYFGLKSIQLLPAIVVNYGIAALAGFMHGYLTFRTFTIDPGWWVVMLVLSFLFISLFFVMARTTQTQGVSVATNASKMSMVMPVLVLSIIHPEEQLTLLQYLGIVLAIFGIYLTSHKPSSPTKHRVWLWPTVLFLGTGLLDYLLVYANKNLVHSADQNSAFTTLSFLLAGIWGTLILTYQIQIKKRIRIRKKDIMGGILLGMVNYGSIFFLLQAYASQWIPRAVLLPINNMGILVFSVLFSIALFKEKLYPLNWAGVMVSLASIIIVFLA
jgi:drug/metabolite transporter (DMT)-like permease